MTQLRIVSGKGSTFPTSVLLIFTEEQARPYLALNFSDLHQILNMQSSLSPGKLASEKNTKHWVK
jgi:hypothetical protein